MTRDTLTRRQGLALIAGSLLLPALPAVAEESLPESRDFVRYRGASGGSVRIDRVRIAAGGRSFAADLSQRVHVIEEDRIATNHFLGGFLTRPTIGERLDGAREIGAVALSGNDIVLQVDAPLTSLPRLVIAHRGRSWDVPPFLAAPGGAGGGARIGTLHLDYYGELLATLPPVA
ncbi:hypothetical protein HKCCE2091_08380 [Rhodobacterales bacterium HKCCE2091]|nr:hypothetical protein [Rhodobacterales bacterium HKCCE2091]